MHAQSPLMNCRSLSTAISISCVCKDIRTCDMDAFLKHCATKRSIPNERRVTESSSSRTPRISYARFAYAEGGRCWDGYEPVPGKEPYSKGSCRKEGSGDGEAKKRKRRKKASGSGSESYSSSDDDDKKEKMPKMTKKMTTMKKDDK